MEPIECGSIRCTLDARNDGLLSTHWQGVVTPSSAASLSARLLEIAAHEGLDRIIGNLQSALLAIPPVTARYYCYVDQARRHIPVAMLVSPVQAELYHDVTASAAAMGTMRRAFRSADDAQTWLATEARALQANRLWWTTRRSLSDFASRSRWKDRSR